MQVYLVQRNPADAGILFRNFNDILPSLKISYSRAESLSITMHHAIDGPKFVLYGGMDNKEFEEEYTTRRLSVYDSPIHLVHPMLCD